MNDPNVSVVVPNYNHARFLRRRIDGILSQTYQDFELILLDDASTDASLEILDAYRTRARTRIVFNEKNSGSPFAQWNQGISQARGKYVWLAESDDDAAPDLLAGLIALLESNADAGVAYCASRLIDENGRQWGTVPDPGRSKDQGRFGTSFVRSGRVELLAQLTAVCNELPNASSAVFRTETLRASGAADASYGLVGDWQLYARVYLQGDVAFTPAPWNGFRCHTHSARERHRRSGRRWREQGRFYQWALGLDVWTEFERRTVIERFCNYLVTDLRETRALVGIPSIAKVVLAMTVAHPWIRVPLFRTFARQFSARVVGSH